MNKDTRLVQMIKRERSQSGLSERQHAITKGIPQQTLINWSKGMVPSRSTIPKLATFLGISNDMAEELVEEARISTGNTKIPKLTSARPPLTGSGSSSALVFVGRPIESASPDVAGTYALRVDGRLMWVDPDRAPTAGNKVVLRSGNSGRLAVWPVDEEIAGVVVLMELA